MNNKYDEKSLLKLAILQIIALLDNKKLLTRKAQLLLIVNKLKKGQAIAVTILILSALFLLSAILAK